MKPGWPSWSADTIKNEVMPQIAGTGLGGRERGQLARIGLESGRTGPGAARQRRSHSVTARKTGII